MASCSRRRAAAIGCSPSCWPRASRAAFIAALSGGRICAEGSAATGAGTAPGAAAAGGAGPSTGPGLSGEERSSGAGPMSPCGAAGASGDCAGAASGGISGSFPTCASAATLEAAGFWTSRACAEGTQRANASAKTGARMKQASPAGRRIVSINLAIIARRRRPLTRVGSRRSRRLRRRLFAAPDRP